MASEAELRALRRKVRGVKVALWLLLVVIVDVLCVSAATGFDDSTAAWRFQRHFSTRTGPVAAGIVAFIYATPDGYRVSDARKPVVDASDSDKYVFPPADWTAVMYVSQAARYGWINTGGLFSPWYITTSHRVRIYDAIDGGEDSDPAWRGLYCDWLATSEPGFEQQNSAYAEKLRGGDSVETSIVWPLLINEVVVIGLSIWCGSVLVRRPIRSMRLLKRWDSRGCPECGYDLGEMRSLGCPECGWGRGEDG